MARVTGRKGEKCSQIWSPKHLIVGEKLCGQKKSIGNVLKRRDHLMGRGEVWMSLHIGKGKFESCSTIRMGKPKGRGDWVI